MEHRILAQHKDLQENKNNALRCTAYIYELLPKSHAVKFKVVGKTKSAPLPGFGGTGVTVVVRVGTAAKENTC